LLLHLSDHERDLLLLLIQLLLRNYLLFLSHVLLGNRLRSQTLLNELKLSDLL